MGCTSSVHAAPPRTPDSHKPQRTPLLGRLFKQGEGLCGTCRGQRVADGDEVVVAGEQGGAETSCCCDDADDALLLFEADQKWMLRATALASASLPFIPARVSTAFASGYIDSPDEQLIDKQHGSTQDELALWAPPRTMRAAVLIVDVSGFTSLSEDARRRLGSEGVERFSIAISAFFATMMKLIVDFQGDVDCFAGDAVLVVFKSIYEPQASVESIDIREKPFTGDEDARKDREAVLRALECALSIHARLDGFQHEPEDPPLRVHSALAAGGSVAKRSEALILSSALSELSVALGVSKKSEIVLAPSAAHLFGAKKTADWERIPLSTGHSLLRPQNGGQVTSCALVAELNNDDTGPTHMGEDSHQLSWDILRLPSYGNSIIMCPPELVVRRMLQQGQRAKAPSLLRRSFMFSKGMIEEDAPSRSRKLSRQEVSKSLDGLVQRDSANASSGEHEDDMGLDALLRFMPAFVRNKCLSGYNFNTLMEHRMVSILFIIADMKEHEGRYRDSAWLGDLTGALGSSIDTVEAQMGGATRQITVDDKGLAMIFVFGLPGYRSNRQTLPCMLAGRKVLNIMAGAGVKGTAGITMGMCFCGLVGDPKIRCEYAVMGDYVNIAARLASAAARQGETILCSEAVFSATNSIQLSAHQLALQPAGTLKLKGKHGEVKVYRQAEADRGSLDIQSSASIDMIGREAEMQLLQRIVSGSLAGVSTSVSVVCIEGLPGVGKSAILDSLMRVAVCGGGGQWMLIRGSEDVNTPFMACRTIVRWMLELEGEPEAGNLSWPLGDFALGSNLPPMLRKYANSIKSLRVGKQEKLAELEALYCDIILGVLGDKHKVLLLDDIDKFDAQSLAVLRRIADSAQRSQRSADGRHGEGADVSNVHSAMICTSRAHNLLGIGKAFKAVAYPSELPARLSILVPPLHDRAIADIARRSLGSSLVERIADLVVERSNGMPLQAVELCQWLQIEGLVVDGQLSAKAESMELDTLVPPSVRAMVQSQIDQLPTVPVVVLRCASVLGNQFNTETLFNTLPKGIVQNMVELAEQLRFLKEAHLLQWVVRFDYRGSNRTDCRDTWKFCNTLHQEVVYRSMPHAHRRRLHKKAAWAVEAQLKGSKDELERRPLLRTITQHLVKSSRSSIGGREGSSSFMRMQEEEVQSLADALEQAAENSLQLQDYGEALAYRIQLMTMLRAQNDMTDSTSITTLMLESEAVEALKLVIIPLFLLDSAILRTFTSDAQAKCAELASRQEELQGAISALEQIKSGSSNAQAMLASKKYSGLPFTRRIAITAKFTALALEYVTNKGFNSSAQVKSLMDEIRLECPAIEKTFLCSLGTIALVNQASCWERNSLGKMAAQAFEDAEQPYRMNDVGGVSVAIGLIAFWLSGQLWSGHLRGSVEARANVALTKLDKSHTCYLIIFWEATEASWTSMRSQRVARLFRQRAQVPSPKKLLYHLVRCLDYLHKAQASAQLLASFLLSAHVQDISVAQFMQSFCASMDGAVAAAERSAGNGIHSGLSCVARACIQEASSLLFPAAPPQASHILCASHALTPGALQHLAYLTAVLSRCLAAWVKHAANVFGDMSFLPSTLMWARSMLHLFQWVLLTAGHQTDVPQAIHLPEGLHGFGKVGASFRPRDGPVAVLSGLQLAQQIGASRGELLVGCLPATVALARLLLAEGCCDVLHRELASTGVVVRVGVPPCVEGSPAENQVEVTRVMCGSRAAREVATAHLEGVMRSVVVQGNPLSLSQAQGPADVGDSESLWEAVQLWRQLQEHGSGKHPRGSQLL